MNQPRSRTAWPKGSLSVASILLAITACAAPPPPPAPDPTAEAVKAEIRQLYVDLSARDWEKFGAHFTSDAVVIFKTRKGAAKTMSMKEFDAMTRKGVEGKPVYSEECDRLDVRVHRDLAHAWSHFRAKIGTAEKVDTWSGIDAYTILRVDGAWKIAAIAISEDE
jgi:ketosteroid isomerase-like protein